jgi:hypothetical protein
VTQSSASPAAAGIPDPIRSSQIFPQQQFDGPFRAVHGFGHYLGGSGSPVATSFGNIDTSNVSASSFPAVSDRIAQGTVGTYEIQGAHRSYGTSGLNNAGFLGVVTLELNGQLNVSGSGDYTFQGSLSAVPDLYDMNPSDHRSPIADASVTVGRGLGNLVGAKDYRVYITGSRRVDER